MPRLTSRERSIPYGYKFRIPALNWEAPPAASFDAVVRSAIAVLQGNPTVAKQLGWDLSYSAMADRVDEFNAIMAEKMGWTAYYTGRPGGASVNAPFTVPPATPYPPSLPGRFARAAAGGKAIVDWINSKEEGVPHNQAEARAGVCAGCSFNEKGDWLRFFTVPVSEAIRAALQQRRNWNLSTSHDNDLGVCNACDCPMKLKVHMPLERIKNALSQETAGNLPGHCWIRKELDALPDHSTGE